jgi:N-methylhydantoinase B
MMGGTDENGTSWTFYETNGGGMGARPTMDGIDGIHCHMTNTLNTPIEAIERYFPILITRYELADDTGGTGKYRGGNGLIRSFTLRNGTAKVSLLADRHTLHPKGSHGGGDAAIGKHSFVRNGKEETIPAKTTRKLEPGDTVIVQTPGGGGYGASGTGKPGGQT